MDPDEKRGDTATAPRSRSNLPTRTSATFVLVVADGLDKGMRFALDGTQPSRVLVGKSPACELRLTDPSVSRRHAALDVAGQWLRLNDLASTNGTFVNGIAIVDAYLDGGEFVRIGDTTFHVTRLEAETTIHVSPRASFGRVVGASSEMRRLYPLCERLANTDVTVILEGETGTGKEVLAESLHEEGSRAKGPFIVFDCTAVPPNLLESSLFGHEKGAFTGAVASRPGVFEQAHTGTLLIDEIGELDLSLQPKLLRALQRSEVQRVGSNKWVKVNVRVLAATRRDLDREVQAGRFRDDLFFRLNVARVELPPLRRRTGDVALLAQHFWNALGGGERPMPHDVLTRFEDYTWPGNVRELHNAVARCLALGEFARFEQLRERATDANVDARGDSANGDAGPDFIDGVIDLELGLSEARQRILDEFERRYVERMLERHGGNVVKAAAASGIARRYFYLIRARQAKHQGD